jgi:hypothetical protein
LVDALYVCRATVPPLYEAHMSIHFLGRRRTHSLSLQEMEPISPGASLFFITICSIAGWAVFASIALAVVRIVEHL